MNKKIVWAIAAIVVLVGALYLTSKSPGDAGVLSGATTTPTTTTTTKSSASKGGSIVQQPTKTAVTYKVVGAGSIKDLFQNRSLPLVCSIKVATTYVNRSGTIYMTEKKMRGDFTGYVNGVLASTSMLDDGESLYVWKNGASTGLKLPAAVSASGNAIQLSGGLDLTTVFSYNCNPWTVEQTNFDLPAGVVFSDTR